MVDGNATLFRLKKSENTGGAEILYLDDFCPLSTVEDPKLVANRQEKQPNAFKRG